jgi:phospholipase/carboxylesterase
MAHDTLDRPHVFQRGTSSRTLLLLHGTGADEHDLIGLGTAIDPAASLLSPRGMYVEAGMNRFFERYPDGTFNEASIDVAADELSGFVGAAIAEYEIDASNIFAVGFSNGANTAAALLIRHPQVLTGAALFGSTRPYRQVEPVALEGKSIWLANGDYDSYAPVEVSDEWVAQLREFGADAVWLRHSGGHQISAEHVQIIRDALVASTGNGQ